MPSFYSIFIVLYLFFILVNIFTDLTNPALNIVTLINNPQAMLSAVPVFIFSVSANNEDLSKVYNLFKAVCIIFLLTWIIPIPGRIPFYQGFIASHAIIPFFIISLIEKRRLPMAIALVGLVAVFSVFSDYRIVLLKVLVFFSFFFSLKFFKSNWFIKLIIILIGCSFIYFMLNNLADLLDFFKDFIGKKDFDSNDTRSFLYQELFEDLKKSELFLGRGFLGTYFSPYFLMLIEQSIDDGDFYQRFGVEVGFLQLVLKGGLAYYFLYTLPLWYVAIKSIFWHPDLKIAFYFGIYILTELLLMFFENIPYFSFQFSILFFLAGYAYRMIYLEKLVKSYVLK